MEAQKEEFVLEGYLKKFSLLNVIVSLGCALLGAVTISYGFYYKTTDTLQIHTIQINETKSEMKEVKQDASNAAAFKSVYESESRELKERMKRIEDKQDRMLEIVIKNQQSK